MASGHALGLCLGRRRRRGGRGKRHGDNAHPQFGRRRNQFATIGDIDDGLVRDIDNPAQRNTFEKQTGAFGEDL